MPSVVAPGRADLTDAQWALLGPLLPSGKKAGRPSKWPKRQLVDGIRWRTRTGAPWRDVPARYGAWQTIYGLFRRWQRAGVWASIHTRLQALADAAGQIVWDVSVDSTIARAHQHAAGARRDGAGQVEPPGGVEADPMIMRWGARVGAGPRKRIWRASGAVSRCRSSSPQASAVTVRSSRGCSMRSGCRGSGRAGRGAAQRRCWRTRRTVAPPTASTSADGAFGRRSRSSRTRPRTGSASVRPVAGPRCSTASTTSSGMRSSAASTFSSRTVPWQPDTTSSLSAIPPRSASARSVCASAPRLVSAEQTRPRQSRCRCRCRSVSARRDSARTRS